jgi:hypothetical protein
MKASLTKEDEAAFYKYALSHHYSSNLRKLTLPPAQQ